MESGGFMPVKSLLCFGATVLLSPFAGAQVSFQFDYSDSTAALWSPESRAALTAAANNVSTYLTGYTKAVTITMKVTGSQANNGSLAGAGSRYLNPAVGFSNLGVIGNEIISGTNSGLGYDGTIDANFFHNWSYTDTVSSSQYDFVSVMMHEIAHAMGFASLLTQTGDSAFGEDGYLSPFDSFLVNSAGQPLVYQGSFTTGTEWDAASTGGTGNGIFFNGPNAVAIYGGLVPIYSPTSWAEGSSGSHLDTTVFTDEERKLMNHSVTPGLGERGFSDLEIAMFRDLGFTAFGLVPEPATCMLVLVAAGGFLVHRRRMPAAAA